MPSRPCSGRIHGKIVLIVLSVLAVWASATQATPPRTPITVSLSISETPRLYEEALLTIEVRSVLDAPATAVELVLPEGVTAERTQWTMDLKAGSPVTVTTSWSFVAEPGNVSLSASIPALATL